MGGRLKERLGGIVDHSGKLAVSENMTKLLEDEARDLRSRVSREVTLRATAEQDMSDAQRDLKHTNKKASYYLWHYFGHYLYHYRYYYFNIITTIYIIIIITN